jgi:ABC-type multidrug transport system fused ATPase/permease subunit
MLIKSKLLKTLITTHKYQLVLVYAINLLETTFYLFIPAAAGYCIDHFIEKQFWGVWAFAVAYIGWQGIATVRKMIDTRIFTKMYANISLKIIQHHKETGIESGIINARVELLKQVVQFFEEDFPFMLNSIIEMFGSAFLLYFYNPKILLVCIIIVVPSFIANRFYSRKMIAATTAVNNEYEKQIDVIVHQQEHEIADYFGFVRQLNIRKSNLEAFNFATLEFFVFAMIVSSLYIITQTDNIKYGEIVATYGYINRFAFSFDFIPHLTGRVANLQDINKRIENVY